MMPMTIARKTITDLWPRLAAVKERESVTVTIDNPPWFDHHMRGSNRTVILNGHPTMDY